MSPKNKKNKKKRSRRYTCELCNGIDNSMMIQCDQCELRYHLKCLNVDSIHEDDEWICLECNEKEKSQSKTQEPQANESNSQSASNPQGQTENSRKEDDKEASKDENASQSQGHHSKSRSSSNHWVQIELQLIEEERELKAKRDREYLESKYKVLRERYENSEGSRSERKSTDRSSYTQKWVQHQQNATKSMNETQIPMIFRRKDGSTSNVQRIQDFTQTIDDFGFDKTSPFDRQVQAKSLKEVSASRARSLERNTNRERIPRPDPDATQHTFRDRTLTFENVWGPNSNSTFATSRNAQANPIQSSSTAQLTNDRMEPEVRHRFARQFRENIENRNQQTLPPSPDVANPDTLEWDNYFEMQSLPENPHQSLVLSRLQTYREEQAKAIPKFGNSESQRLESHQSSVNNKASNSQGPRRVEFKELRKEFEQLNIPNGSDDSDRKKKLLISGSNVQNRSSSSSINGQSNRYERDSSNREYPGSSSQSQSKFWNNQPNISSSTSMNAVGNITANQIASRHVVKEKLPIFDGDPSEWLLWYHQYKSESDLCGYSNAENHRRLTRSLQGKTKSAVEGFLLHPESVPFIIDTLKRFFGRPELIIKTIIAKIRSRQPIRADSVDELISFAFQATTIATTIELLERPGYLSDPMLIDELVDKLPIQEKKDWAKYEAQTSHVTLKTLSVWLFDLATVYCTVSKSTTKQLNERKTEKGKFDKNEKSSGLELVNFHVGPNDSNRQRKQTEKPQCPICKNDCNKVENCAKFKSFDVNARWKVLNENKLCRRCLRKHKSPCFSVLTCGRNGCQFKHHSMLHNDDRHSTTNSNPTATTKNTIAASNFHNAMHIATMLRIVPVILYNGAKAIATFAFLDEGTTVTMMEKRLAVELGLRGTSEQICLIWTKNIHRREQAERVSLEISGINGFDKRYEMKGVRTVDDLNLPAQSINRDELITKFPYLKDVPFVSYKNAIPGIMIGSDMPKFGSQLEVVESEEIENNEFNGPNATRTRLGWSIHGPRDSPKNEEYVNTHQLELCPHHNEFDNEVHQRVKEFFSVENFGVQASSKLNQDSKNDEKALEMLKQLTKKVNGRYETGLLWKSDKTNLPDSYPMALKRLISLERHGPEMIRTMGAKIADYVSKGYARKLTALDLKYSGPVWYLPLFGVIHPKKPEKIRMVFDAAAKVKTVSLNSVLLKGPDLYTSLIDILRRFRERLITGGGDIAEMFHQVKVIEEDRHFQRFLFRDDKTKTPDVYQMDVLTFGACCSPSSAQFVKNENAKKFIKTHPRAVSAIVDNHYVDDMMESEHSETEMIQLIRDVTMIHAKAGFQIRNFISNSTNVLNAIGEGETNDVKDIAPKTELKVERVLGMWYNTKSDSFTFSLKHTLIDANIFNGSKMPTKREILRTLMSIFDPLGLLSNFLIYLKILIQDIWKSKLDWDTQISSEHLVERWKRWLSVLPQVESVNVPRLYSPRMSPHLPKSIQMHVFVDASEEAFAAVVYLRIEDINGVDVAFVGSKSRAAPIKYLSIPRMELQGSILGTRLSTSIKGAQRLNINQRVMWTDSATVISWLNSENRKYSQFVAHRVGEILESSDVNEWRWIPTNENVADEATKWSRVPNFKPTNRWFSGPEFLRKSENEWPKKKIIEIDTEEEMKANFLHSSLVLPKIIDPERFSKYNRMVRSLAYAIRFINLLTGKSKKGEPLQQEELCTAENLIIRQSQFEGFPTEMVTLMRNEILPIDQRKPIEKPSVLYDCTPFLDVNDIIRVKGRIDGARELSMNTKRPIVLSKESRITQLLLHDYHSKYFHQNHETVVNEVRQKYYIPRLREMLKKIKGQCQSCKIKKAHPVPPQMADLPQARLATRFIPFSFVGIDFFGPMYVLVGRRREKRWGVLFTCLTIRAIHIEIANGLDTNSCILCIQNFVADRGPVIEFHSDWGTNFKGSNNELQEELKKVDPKRLKTEFTSTYTKWIFNPPASPHMGGSWERLIRSVKSLISEIMPTRTPKEDMLRNMMKQVQNVINSRPLTFIPLDVEEDEALTPNHFLKLSSNGQKPPCEIELDGTYLRKSWKESQRLTEIFWKRFIREYLPSITRRTKWHKKVSPLKEGDLVLVVDENSPRNTYPKAKILRTATGSNNQVRRAEVELIAGTKSNSNGQIYEVKKTRLWRPAHKLALLDVAARDGLAQPGLDRETGGSVGATGFESNVSNHLINTDRTDATVRKKPFMTSS